MHKRLALAPVLVCWILLVASCASDSTTDATAATAPSTSDETAESADGSSATSSSQGSSDRDFSEIEAALGEFVEANGLSGAGLAVVDADDGVVFEGYAGDFTPDRASLVASMSKQVTAGVLLRLDDEGVLDIDAPISEIVGDAWGSAGGDDSLADRTIAQMLSHSAGMIGLSELRYAPYFCQFNADQNIEDCGADIYSTPNDDGDLFAPDSRWEYGGGQWQLAGAIAEYVSGESWADLVERIYIEPCDLGDGFGYTNHWATLAGGSTDYPSAYSGDASQLDATENPNIEGGLYTTVPDYAALLTMYLRGGACPNGQVLSQGAIDEMHADRIGIVYDGDARNGNGYGIGWWVDRTTGRVFNDGAYGSQAWLDLDGGYGAYLVVEDGPGKSFRNEIEPLLDELMTG